MVKRTRSRSSSKRKGSKRRSNVRRSHSKPRVTRKRKSSSRRKRRRSSKSKRKANPQIKAWVKAAKAEGYMRKGKDFKPLPKKGTAGYKAIKARYESILI